MSLSFNLGICWLRRWFSWWCQGDKGCQEVRLCACSKNSLISNGMRGKKIKVDSVTTLQRRDYVQHGKKKRLSESGWSELIETKEWFIGSIELFLVEFNLV